jgi:hypothetical protein
MTARYLGVVIFSFNIGIVTIRYLVLSDWQSQKEKLKYGEIWNGLGDARGIVVADVAREIALQQEF